MMAFLVICVLAYLIGSIPSSVWVGKIYKGIDVREHGSGNAGATNTFRVLGKKAGIPVLLLDITKGTIAVNLVWFQTQYGPFPAEIIPYTNLKLAFGFCGVVGHIFPVFAGFRGGKGIATLLGLLIGLHAVAALYSILVFVIVFITSKYVSLGSIIASIAFPILVILILGSTNVSLNLFAFFVPILSLITHQKNIERLLRGEETKVKFGTK